MTSCSWSAAACDDALLGVADGGDADAGAEVDELVAVDVDEDRAVRALDVDGQRRGDAGGDDLRASRRAAPPTSDRGWRSRSCAPAAPSRPGRPRSGRRSGCQSWCSNPIAADRRAAVAMGQNRMHAAARGRGGPACSANTTTRSSVEWQGDRGEGTTRLPRLRPPARRARRRASCTRSPGRATASSTATASAGTPRSCCSPRSASATCSRTCTSRPTTA